MLGFWIAAAVASAATGAALLLFARRAMAAGEGHDPTRSTYQRQLQEVDDLAARGLLAPQEREAARAEAARRLLQAARRERMQAATAAGRGRTALVAAVLAPLLALGIYLGVGRPGVGDQPFKARVAQWRAEPERLGPAEAAAVLETITRDRPRDAQAHAMLGRARFAAGDSFGAARAFETAARLEPARASHWVDLAQALLGADAPATAEARRALARALAADPADLNARYWLGRVELVEGNTAAAGGRWRALAAELPAGDPRRAALQAEIAGLASNSDVPPRADPAITGMVEGLARRLRESPDDPEGWARLVRAYAVLGREAELQAALTEARRLFASRPAVLQRVEAEAEAGRRVQQGR